MSLWFTHVRREKISKDEQCFIERIAWTRSQTFVTLVSNWRCHVLLGKIKSYIVASLKTMAILLLLKTMAMLLWKEVPCFENLQMAYCVNYHNIPGYFCQRSAFFDCCCNMRHFLCGVERVKLFANIHLHCIVSNLKRMCNISTLFLWKNFCGRPWK